MRHREKMGLMAYVDCEGPDQHVLYQWILMAIAPKKVFFFILFFNRKVPIYLLVLYKKYVVPTH